MQLILKNLVERITTHVQTCLATNQVVASCVNTDFWLDKITWELRDTQELGHLLQNICLRPVKRPTSTDFFAKRRTTLYVCNNFSQLTTTRWFVALEVWFFFIRRTPPLPRHLRVGPCCSSVICFWIVTGFVLDRYRIQPISHASHLI